MNPNGSLFFADPEIESLCTNAAVESVSLGYAMSDGWSCYALKSAILTGLPSIKIDCVCVRVTSTS